MRFIREVTQAMKWCLKLFRKILSTVLVMVCLGIPALTIGESSCPILGSWSFYPEGNTLDLVIDPNGSALYQGMIGSWHENEDGTITIATLNGKETVLRYEQTETGWIVYPRTEYMRSETANPDGIVGTWYVPETPRVSFVFNEDGTFAEDTAFSGTYTVDEENGTIRLDYGGFFDPVVCRFSMDGDRLVVEYPWTLYPVK